MITEYEENVEVFSQGFRDRNRIVAGLSVGTLVVEAKVNSGTGITAEYVRKFNRHLFCIPHVIEDEAGVGTNNMIKKGGKLVTCIEDILKYYDGIKEVEKQGMMIDVPNEYKSIFENITKEPINSDEISKKTKESISKINTVLTMLELEGFIESLPGNYYRRKVL